jgi:hypothetical protein
MTEVWGRGWVRWLAGFVFGLVLGYALFIVGIFGLLIAGLTLVLAVAGRWRLAFVSGWFSGIGAVVLWLMLRVLGYCSADPTCVVSSGTQTWLGISLGLLLAGLLTGIAAWRRKRKTAERAA